MFVVYVPPAVFIDRVLSAAEGDDELLGYGALAVLLARSADATELQDKVERDWSSIHDVTGSWLLVITPVSADSQREGVAKSGGKLVVGEGITFRTALQEHCRRAFSSEGAYERTAPLSGSWREEATHAVTDTLHYFGLPESISPCLLVLSFWDKDAYIIRVDDLFNPYTFFKDVASCGAPHAQRLEELRRQIVALDDEFTREERRMGRRYERTARLSRLLREVADQLPEQSHITDELALILSSESSAPPAHSQMLIERITGSLVDAARDRRIAKDLADNLPKSLRAALATEVSLPAHARKRELQGELREAQHSRRLGEALAFAAIQQGFTQGAPIPIARPKGWRTRVFERTSDVSMHMYVGVSAAGNR